MNGTTLCPYCNSHFSISETQLDVHEGMVRCGYCQKTFDARLSFVSDQPSPQLELPILQLLADLPQPDLPVLQPMTLAEKVSIVEEESEEEIERPIWHWALGSVILMMVFISQCAYMFRADIAAKIPVTKPVLVYSCWLLNCKVGLPQYPDLISIESSGLEADPKNKGWITLKVLLRNRAPFTQTYPNLELTLSDSKDAPQARRIFSPADYLPKAESYVAGLRSNKELGVQLFLDTGNLKPMGYRLALFYPDQ
ncbi:MAG: zinc-ribbon and DUF3426 domain-containing protein [Gallionella sp.]